MQCSVICVRVLIYEFSAPQLRLMASLYTHTDTLVLPPSFGKDGPDAPPYAPFALEPAECCRMLDGIKKEQLEDTLRRSDVWVVERHPARFWSWRVETYNAFHEAIVIEVSAWRKDEEGDERVVSVHRCGGPVDDAGQTIVSIFKNMIAAGVVEKDHPPSPRVRTFPSCLTFDAVPRPDDSSSDTSPIPLERKREDEKRFVYILAKNIRNVDPGIRFIARDLMKTVRETKENSILLDGLEEMTSFFSVCERTTDRHVKRFVLGILLDMSALVGTSGRVSLTMIQDVASKVDTLDDKYATSLRERILRAT
jgi:hypothetical protein